MRVSQPSQRPIVQQKLRPCRSVRALAQSWHNHLVTALIITFVGFTMLIVAGLVESHDDLLIVLSVGYRASVASDDIDAGFIVFERVTLTGELFFKPLRELYLEVLASLLLHRNPFTVFIERHLRQ